MSLESVPRPHVVRSTGRTMTNGGPARPHRTVVVRLGESFHSKCSCGWRSHEFHDEADAGAAGLFHLRKRASHRRKEREQAVAARMAGFR